MNCLFCSDGKQGLLQTEKKPNIRNDPSAGKTFVETDMFCKGNGEKPPDKSDMSFSAACKKDYRPRV